MCLRAVWKRSTVRSKSERFACFAKKEKKQPKGFHWSHFTSVMHRPKTCCDNLKERTHLVWNILDTFDKWLRGDDGGWRLSPNFYGNTQWISVEFVFRRGHNKSITSQTPVKCSSIYTCFLWWRPKNSQCSHRLSGIRPQLQMGKLQFIESRDMRLIIKYAKIEYFIRCFEA